MTPRDAFKTFVLPAVKDCEADPGALHRVVSALFLIDALAEEVWNSTNKPEGTPTRYREALAAKCTELGYAWDVHDIHKHGKLDRRVPILPNDKRPQVVLIRRQTHHMVTPTQPFIVWQTGGWPVVILTLQDGTTVRALDVIKKCVGWWDAELSRLGWP
jgi:hypothetical protein